MTVTVKRFSPSTSQLTTSASTIYTATGLRAQVLAATVTNTSGGAVSVTIYLVPNGQSAGDANTLVKARSLNAGESYKVIELVGQAMNAGDTIQALASANTAISMMVGGAEYSG